MSCVRVRVCMCVICVSLFVCWFVNYYFILLFLHFPGDGPNGKQPFIIRSRITAFFVYFILCLLLPLPLLLLFY
ncbi:hypothetical protein J3Q64DRAFT_1744469 [Phycomyces blakesleeanus]|uniref:Uncharacterized protein n=1 Tax=Phycomyces blakesleeanus TaxID=4837 RepID=A0ABR3AYZ2_PHYBL